jgi:hypothetical protein
LADGYSKGIPFGGDESGEISDVQVNGTSVVTDGVANVPVANATTFGTIKVSPFYGHQMTNGILSHKHAGTATIKSGQDGADPIVSKNQHESTFYGLAKAAGHDEKNSTLSVGQYTEEAKSAISDMLNGAVQVSGTTPTITALSGVRYVCGEVSTLDITPCATGICDIVFTSGSTATVLTLPNTVKFSDGTFTFILPDDLFCFLNEFSILCYPFFLISIIFPTFLYLVSECLFCKVFCFLLY